MSIFNGLRSKDDYMAPLPEDAEHLCDAMKSPDFQQLIRDFLNETVITLNRLGITYGLDTWDTQSEEEQGY